MSQYDLENKCAAADDQGMHNAHQVTRSAAENNAPRMSDAIAHPSFWLRAATTVSKPWPLSSSDQEPRAHLRMDFASFFAQFSRATMEKTVEDISTRTTPETPARVPDTAKTAKTEAKPHRSNKSWTLDEQKLRQPESALIRWLYRAPTHDLNAPPAGDSETGFEPLPGR